MREHMNFHLTTHGIKKIKSEIKRLKEQHIRFSRLWRGNTADRDDYQHSVELMEQSSIPVQIQELEKILKLSKPLGPNGNRQHTRVDLGRQVYIKSSQGEQMVTLVESIEADPFNGYISADAPLGKAIIGKKVGDSVQVDTPKGTQSYTIVNIF